MKHASLFAPLRLGAVDMPNRIVMAPLTRMRANADNVPSALNALYYAQRADAGLIIAEGTAISPEARGYPHAPGIYTEAQIKGWRLVTEAVHRRGGRIILQLAHNGRNSHSSFRPDGGPPVAPSAIAPDIPVLTSEFQQVSAETPRALEVKEIAGIVEDFRLGAIRAMEAGFDGVELQGANSHLIDQFLQDGTNQRTDEYGGDYENRMRLLGIIVGAVSSAIGCDRLGVRLSPFGQYGGIHDSDPLHLFRFVISTLDRLKIGYLHLIEGRASEIGLGDLVRDDALNNAMLFRPSFHGPLISAGAYSAESAAATIMQGHADAIAFGRMYIANPDLVTRIQQNLPLNDYDRSTFYGGGEQGYTDYAFCIPRGDMNK
jgi:N-ethylmaleimide reductase